MAERFTKLQAFPENLYTDMAPVVIIAGNLLKDNQLNRVLAQLKIQNIDKRTINEMTLQFRLMDVNGKTLDDAYVCKIEHTQIAENDFYGSKNPVTIPNANVCSCDIKVTQVKFADGTVWNCGNNWAPLDTTTNINGVKETRDRKLSEATRKKEKEEYEARVQEEKHRAESKRTIIIVVAVIACIAIAVGVLYAVIQNYIVTERKEKLETALIGTTWYAEWENYWNDYYTDRITFSNANTIERYLIIKSKTEEKVHEYSVEWSISEISEDRATITRETYEKFEVYFKEEDGKYKIISLTGDDENRYEQIK